MMPAVLGAFALLLTTPPSFAPFGVWQDSAAPADVAPRGATSDKGAPRQLRVPRGGSLQAVINDARAGDTIVLEAGQTYQGPFRLPKKDGDGWITITGETASRLREGERVSPAHAASMPKLVSGSGSVLSTDSGSHHFKLVGIEIAPVSGRFLYALVELGDAERDPKDLPHHFVVDRCYLHGDAKAGSRRGVALNSRETEITNSYFADFKEVGNDSQAIAGWNGPGPFTITNNYLEAAGENIMFGGADPTIPGLVPADIVIKGNHLAKPLRWRVGDPSFEGTEWAVKNLFELKNAKRVVVDGNLLENNWLHAQNGFAILLTPRNQKGSAPWSTVEDVTFRNNLVRHVAAGINMLGRDDIHDSQPARRITIENNQFSDVGGRWGGNGRLFQLLNGVSDVVITHNTAAQSGGVVFGGDHAPHPRFVFQNNVVLDNGAGFLGSGTSAGKMSIERYFPGAVISRNVFIGGKPSDYPPDNVFSSASEVAGSDGRSPGADLHRIPKYGH